MPTTTVQKIVSTTKNGDERVQYRTTIPKQLAEAFELEDKEQIRWSVVASGAMRIDRVEE